MEANIQYVLSNFTTEWGDPFKLVRIPMPPSTGGSYAPRAYYRTYANHIIVNKSILLSAWVQVLGGLLLGGGIVYLYMRRRKQMRCKNH